MKKVLFTLLAVASFAVAAQAQVWDGESKFIQGGIGIGSPYYAASSDMTIPPIHASFELPLKISATNKIGLGGCIGYTASKYTANYISYEYSWTYSYLIIGARGAYHFLENDKIDLYAGVMAGYNVASAKFKSNDATVTESLFAETSVGGFTTSAYGGVRYMFSDNFGVFSELGYNIAWLSFGVSGKF